MSPEMNEEMLEGFVVKSDVSNAGKNGSFLLNTAATMTTQKHDLTVFEYRGLLL